MFELDRGRIYSAVKDSEPSVFYHRGFRLSAPGGTLGVGPFQSPETIPLSAEITAMSLAICVPTGNIPHAGTGSKSPIVDSRVRTQAAGIAQPRRESIRAPLFGFRRAG